MKLLRRLEDIDPTEVTLCKIPATRKKFLFFKNDMRRLLDTYGMQGDFDSKKRSEVLKKMDDKIKELLKEYFGEEVSFPDEEFEKAKLSDKALTALKGALKLVNKYKADFPDDLKKAVGTLAKYASYGYGYPAKKSDDKDDKVEKAGRVLSKDMVSKIKSIIKALNDILPEAEKAVKKSDTTDGEDANKEFKDTLDEVTDIAKKLEKKLEDKDSTIEKLNKRLEIIEKEKGIKKGIDGQDDDDEGKPTKKWPSFGV